jgi:sarcosine/dimethylglycine N-methyltransferase
MQKTKVTLADVEQVYDGPEGRLWQLIMGEQIHVGGFASSMVLADKAGITSEMLGIDLCCCLTGGMRFLVKNYGCEMHGIDACATVYKKGLELIEEEGLGDKIKYIPGDVTNIKLGDGVYDFVWGEDAWCYVMDKEALIKEAVRIVKRGGKIAFTDWVEGPEGLADDEANRINTFMKFPYLESPGGYVGLLEQNGCVVDSVEDLTGEFAEYVDLYIDMLTKQLTFDALRIIGGDIEMLQAMGAEMAFMSEMAHAGKMGRCRIIATKKI